MLGKAVAREVSCGEYKVSCPRCSRTHLLSQVSPDRVILNSDVDDDFVICDGGTAKCLHPIFVCRNSSCSFEGTVSFPRSAA